jgi:hypothetical protein
MFPGQVPTRDHTTGSGLRYGSGLHLEIEKLYVRLGVSNLPPSNSANTNTNQKRAAARLDVGEGALLPVSWIVCTIIRFIIFVNTSII